VWKGPIQRPKEKEKRFIFFSLNVSGKKSSPSHGQMWKEAEKGQFLGGIVYKINGGK
jgi:hypothetical protein